MFEWFLLWFSLESDREGLKLAEYSQFHIFKDHFYSRNFLVFIYNQKFCHEDH